MYAMPGSGIIPYKTHTPQLGEDVFVASGAWLIGDLTVGDDSSFWFNVTVRADVHWIKIGSRTNIQDGTVIHVTNAKAPTSIGNNVTVGHGAIIHGCTIEDDCLIGMGAKLLDGAIIRKGSFVAAGALVTPGKEFPPGSMIMGSPAKAVRPLTDEEKKSISYSAAHYVDTKRHYMNPPL